MKLIIAEYLRTLRERDQLDVLLPDLIVEMGYVPISLPQAGIRQHGVDCAARGISPVDGEEELLLFVIKQGDIGRAMWDTGVQAVRPSVNEIFDVYLRSHREPQDQSKRVHIVVATNGEKSQSIDAEWAGFVERHAAQAKISFWGANEIAALIETHLLDEFVFLEEDRKLLRRALALSGDSEYDRKDLEALFLSKLGLKSDGTAAETPLTEKQRIKNLRVIHLAVQIYASWSGDKGDLRQGLNAAERAVLWAWNSLMPSAEKPLSDELSKAYGALWHAYLKMAVRYFKKLQAHCFVRDGFYAGQSHAAEFSLVLFEQIGVFASIGLVQIGMQTNDESLKKEGYRSAEAVADTLCALLENNPMSLSPCLDRHCSEISMCLTLLCFTGKIDFAKSWLIKLVGSINRAYAIKSYAPIATDSLDDLAEDDGWCGGKSDERLLSMSWMLPTLASWCAILRLDDAYEILAADAKQHYPKVCMQFWHPDASVYQHLYFQAAHKVSGSAQAPIDLPAKAAEWRQFISTFIKSEHGTIGETSLAGEHGLYALDIVAARHFKIPLPAHLWFKLLDPLTKHDHE